MPAPVFVRADFVSDVSPSFRENSASEPAFTVTAASDTQRTPAKSAGGVTVAALVNFATSVAAGTC